MYLCDVKSYFELLVLSYSKILSQIFYYMLPKNTNKQTNKTLSHCNAAKMRYFVCFHQTARSTVSDKFGNRATSLGHNRGKFYQSYMK